MNYIVLSSTQKEGLEALKQSFTGGFRNWSDYEPIEILTKDSEGDPSYILPLSVLSDPDLKEFNDYVMVNKQSEMVIREVTNDEFIKFQE